MLLVAALATAPAVADDTNADSDILVTLVNDVSIPVSGSIRAPYQARQRYSIAASARKNARDIARDYGLVQIDHWPIRSLNVYCIVLRAVDGGDRAALIERLAADTRVESAQALNEFETGTEAPVAYNDTYAALQHGLTMLDVRAVHGFTQGRGVRVAIVDSLADATHEDLVGRVSAIHDFTGRGRDQQREHGTAVASVIGANANNARGIVGVAPQAELELYVACWSDHRRDAAVCNSFSLAKALDDLLTDPPDVLNLSLTGPDDGLLARLLARTLDAGVVVVAANPVNENRGFAFPANLDGVLAVANAELSSDGGPGQRSLLAPGEQIMVAVPQNAYDFRSGSSLSAAHISGVVALLLSASPDVDRSHIADLLRRSQERTTEGWSVDACVAVRLSGAALNCRDPQTLSRSSER